VIRPVLADGEAPAARAAVGLVAGIFAGAWSVSGARGAALLLAVSSAGLVLAPPRGAAARLSSAALWLSAGFLSGSLRIAAPAARARAAFAALAEDARRSVRLEGTLADFWSGEPPRARSVLRAERLQAPGRAWETFPAEVAVFVSGEGAVAARADRGDRVRLAGHLEEEDLPASDRDVPVPMPRYRLSVKSALLVERDRFTVLSLLTLPNRFLFRALPTGDADEVRNVRGPLAALLLGRTAELDRGMVARYRRGGQYHLLVVSGLHVALAAGLAAALLVALRVEGRRRDAMLLAAVFLFVLVGGANPPAVRAGLVVGILVVTRLVERPIGGPQAIGLSALGLFLAAPEQIFSIGTVLTFAAVSGIALFGRRIRTRLPRRPDWLFSGVAAALAAEAATAPLLFWRFNVVAAGAWLTAPFTVPLAGGLIAVGGLALVLRASGWPAPPLEALFGLGSRALEFLAERAAGIALLRPTPPLAGVLAAEALLVAAGLGPSRLRRPAAIAAAAVFAGLVLWPGPAGPPAGFSVEALDVGQGDAILLRWDRHAILVDGGGPFDALATDFGRTRLVPKLLDRGVTRLDAAVATHPHPDHALGLFAVLEEIPVGELWRSDGGDDGDLYARLEASAAARGVPVRCLPTGASWDRDRAQLTVLHSGGSLRKVDGVNNQSVVAVFARDGRRALLTGDAGAPTEAELLRLGAVAPADVLKVGHHGSRTATTADFVEAVRPRLALVSCGRRNRFGHPAPETLETLETLAVPVLRTDERSDIRVDLLPGATRLDWRGALRP